MNGKRGQVLHGACTHRAELLESAVIEHLGQYSDPKRVAELLAERKAEDASTIEGELKIAADALSALERDFLANLDLLKRGVLDEAEFAKANEARRASRETLQKRKAELDGRLASARKQAGQAEALPGTVRSFLEGFGELDVRRAKARLQSILKAIYVHKDGRIELEFRE